MKQLVVLVGLPGSGKTCYHCEHPEWVVVSRSAIRQAMFRCSFDDAVEETVSRVFHSALVEALESAADVVCIDEPNLTRDDRAPYVEIARLAGREPVAHVMPVLPTEAAYERMQRSLRRLAAERPYLRVRAFPRAAFAAMAERYEPVEDIEGFARIEAAAPVDLQPRAATGAPARARAERAPLPLFSSSPSG